VPAELPGPVNGLAPQADPRAPDHSTTQPSATCRPGRHCSRSFAAGNTFSYRRQSRAGSLTCIGNTRRPADTEHTTTISGATPTTGAAATGVSIGNERSTQRRKERGFTARSLRPSHPSLTSAYAVRGARADRTRAGRPGNAPEAPADRCRADMAASRAGQALYRFRLIAGAVTCSLLR
jgi:hypothetical protein